MAKNKMKTHKATSKICKVRPGGSIKIGVAGSNHNTGKQASAKMRNKKKGGTLSSSDYKRLKDVLGK
jgi:ribosomal protein L35